MRRTKIVCTIGPACQSRQTLDLLIRAGMDVARLNFSHGSHEVHGAAFATIRELSSARGRCVAILQDLCGPKIRTGTIVGGSVSLAAGQEILLTARDVPGSAHIASVPVPELIDALEVGHHLYVDDGKLELRICERRGEDVVARATVAGQLGTRKGVTAPGVPLPIRAITDQDLDDLRYGLQLGVDWVAASYVREASDLLPLRKVMEEMGVHRPIIAKIEKREAVARLPEIIQAADAIMVARGDLGVEAPLDEVPMIQKRIIRLCNRAGKPVITATQMLDSMITSRRPTRAEVTDVANAVLDGTDAVMLSGETAVGRFPLEAVRTMASIARQVEPELAMREHPVPAAAALPIPEAVADAAVEVAEAIHAAAILCGTSTGSTARVIARRRPHTPIIAATPCEATYRAMALTWGVQPLLTDTPMNTDHLIQEVVRAAVDAKLLKSSDKVVITAGIPSTQAGNTNLIKVHVVGQILTH